MVMYANEFKTKENQKLTEIKKINCNIFTFFSLSRPNSHNILTKFS